MFLCGRTRAFRMKHTEWDAKYRGDSESSETQQTFFPRLTVCLLNIPQRRIDRRTGYNPDGTLFNVPRRVQVIFLLLSLYQYFLTY
jgi:hypothetical protein